MSAIANMIEDAKAGVPILRMEAEEADAELAEKDKRIAELEDYYKNIMAEQCDDEIHCTCVPALRKRIEELENCTSYVLDLLRTGVAPEVFQMTETQWMQHKVNKACSNLAALKGTK